MTAHTTYRVIKTTDSIVRLPVFKSVDGRLFWAEREGTDLGFQCFCGLPITDFDEALAGARVPLH